MGQTIQTIFARTGRAPDDLVTAGIGLARSRPRLSGTLDGHTDPVYAVAWSPDGKKLATAGFDNTVRLWDAATRKEIKKFEGHTKLVLAVAISPDGRQFSRGARITPPKSGTYRRRDPRRRSPDMRVQSRPWRSSPTASSSPRRRASRSGSGICRPVPASRNWQVTRATSPAFAGAATADSSRPAISPTPSGSGKATSRRKRRSKVRPKAYWVWLTFRIISSSSPAGSDGIARLWQLPVAVPRRMETKGPVTVFALSREGTKLASAGADKVVRIWNPADGKLVKEIAVEQPVIGVAFPQDSSKLAVALANKSARIYSRRGR